jgi:AGCS family alanine or glycine:cation symporter
MAEIVTGTTLSTTSVFYYIVAVLVVVFTGVMVFKGIRQVTKVTDKMVPVMAILYVVTVLLLIVLNINRIPYFFGAVFGGAFTSEAVFGGVFGTILAQGIKRGLMSNEAGQGTITMAAGAASCDHPCDQGIVQSIGVFLDTIVICTLTGFVVVMAHVWSGSESSSWFAMDRLPKFLASAAELTPGTAMNAAVTFLITFCFCLFAYTCLIGMISFSEIAANRISRKKSFLNGIRILGLFITSFGILCSIAGLDLGNLWAISDLGNILIVFANVPLLYLGANYVFKATRHYKTKDAGKFDSSVIGTECEYWDNRK